MDTLFVLIWDGRGRGLSVDRTRTKKVREQNRLGKKWDEIGSQRGLLKQNSNEGFCANIDVGDKYRIQIMWMTDLSFDNRFLHWNSHQDKLCYIMILRKIGNPLSNVRHFWDRMVTGNFWKATGTTKYPTGLHRYWWRVLETKCVSDNFEMLLTDLRCWGPIQYIEKVINIEKVTDIMILLPAS